RLRGLGREPRPGTRRRAGDRDGRRPRTGRRAWGRRDRAGRPDLRRLGTRAHGAPDRLSPLPTPPSRPAVPGGRGTGGRGQLLHLRGAERFPPLLKGIIPRTWLSRSPLPTTRLAGDVGGACS